MESKSLKDLTKAKQYFYELRLNECYFILRRYFDRLPFQQEKEHAQYIGMFIRVLTELERTNELAFYLSTLEKLHSQLNDPDVSFQLAMVYVCSDPPQLKAASAILEELLKKGLSKEHEAKTKMILACCHDSLSMNQAAVRGLIFSIPTIENDFLNSLIEIWKAKVFMTEQNFLESEKILNRLLSSLTIEKDWYIFFKTKLILIRLYQDWNKFDLAKRLLNEVTDLIQDKPLRMTKRKLATIEKSFLSKPEPQRIQVKFKRNSTHILAQDHFSELDWERKTDRLLSTLIRNKKISKEDVIRILFDRDYNPSKDDSIVYYQIHGIKKRLKKLGLSDPNLNKKGGHYELSAEIHYIEETAET